MSSTQSLQQIDSRLRSGLAVLGLLCLFGAVVLLTFPPVRETIEWVTSATDVKKVTSTADVTYSVVTIFLYGVALILYSANGIQFTRIVAGEYQAHAAEVYEPKERAQAYQNAKETSPAIVGGLTIF